MIKDIKENFSSTLLLSNIFISLAAFLCQKDFSALAYIGLISSISNIICVILCAKQKISNYFWGLLAVVSYAFVAYNYANTGEFMLNTLYYIPMQFIGLYLWKKNKDKDDGSTVKSRKMSFKQSLVVYTLTILGIFVYSAIIYSPAVQIFLYGQVSDYSYFKFFVDSFTTILSVTAMILMVLRYTEQWYLWVVVDVATILLWTITFNPMMIIQWFFMLINAIYGIYVWKKDN